MHLQLNSWILLESDNSCVLLAVNLDHYIHCFIHHFCLQLVTTSCGFAVNSSYRNIIDYWDNSVRISQNIAILFRLLHRLIKNTVGTSSLYHHKSCCVYSSMTCDATWWHHVFQRGWHWSSFTEVAIGSNSLCYSNSLESVISLEVSGLDCWPH